MCAAPALSEADNVRVWDGHKRGHYEVWYVTFNHRESNTGYWIRYALESPEAGRGDPYAQLWFAHFDARDPERTFAQVGQHLLYHYIVPNVPQGVNDAPSRPIGSF